MSDVQIIRRNGEPEYAVLAWADYQALLQAAGQVSSQPAIPAVAEPEPVQQLDLQTLREARGLTVEALAREVGISPAYLLMFERGERALEGAIRSAMARALSVNEMDLG